MRNSIRNLTIPLSPDNLCGPGPGAPCAAPPHRLAPRLAPPHSTAVPFIKKKIEHYRYKIFF